MKHNRNQFNLLMERMSNRYSYDESIDLINKQLSLGSGISTIFKTSGDPYLLKITAFIFPILSIFPFLMLVY